LQPGPGARTLRDVIAGSVTGDRASARRLRVVIVDDRRARRERLRGHLEAGGLVVCAQAADPERWRDAARGAPVDLCVVAGDTAAHAVAIAVELADRPPAVRVVLMGPPASDADLLGAVMAGASGYLSDQLEARLVPALCDIAAGRPAFPARLNTLLVDWLRRQAPAAAI
jgi:DNA-binding NarL/FixJ family response regulator